MWDGLIARLKGTPKTQQPLPEPDEQLALGALLVRVAKSDREYHVTEISEIDSILSKSFEINAVEAAKMRATCEKLEAQAPGTPDFGLIIREHVDYAHRLEMVNAMWKVILADGRDTPEEDAALHEIERVMGIDPKDSPAP
ncbi:MAG: TerB family tellurite resistance protein [Cognatishimia sp.]|uniref:tellurite resistance TerB family protein n=1 Tax=Cognatishimia sp. 1_MG-2023 TaxID=3062642 RepID=UPI0026E1DE52|nr:TerB family tellurite resistance protein [Cognatishimia sp. 1_MG-2023]MDO6726460.1 TerB family tellurite resistance protein [Cognatishimia sp. 1_MG-2023]